MQLEALQSMFPSVDRTVVAAVLEAHTKDGSVDSEAVMARATEDLLQLSDPDFTPEHPRTEHAIDSHAQSALDEEYARSLAAAEHQQHQSLPYQPRTRRAHPQHVSANDDHHHPQTSSNSESVYGYRGGAGADPAFPPAMQNLEEKFEKLAYVGKQKFDSLLQQAQKKYQEVSAPQQQQQQRQGEMGHGGNTAQGLGVGLVNTLGGLWNEASAAVAARTSGPGTAGFNTPYGQTAATRGWNGQREMVGAGVGNVAQGLKGWFDGARTAIAQKTSGANAEYPSLDSADPSTAFAGQSSGPSRRWQPTDTYEPDSQPRSINIHHSSSSASSASSIPSTSDDERDDPHALDIKDNTPRPTSHLAAGAPLHGGLGHAGSGLSPPGKIDLSKIGMLPKKKVSLLPSAEATTSTSTLTGPIAAASSTGNAPTGVAPGNKRVEEDDEEEEYTKNPFEER
ncbi:hypothetical protein QFC21_000465 [Naganishia friedmannii]|uniref:Uncharacterized protein n=1 Tax=Naganishia friedmannii TaxID=89922 RepID=A0ACC2WDJ9_9TREE|nr:hypothetical protein QFC21_000465 [Naganishia friedmannii]